MTIRTTIAPAAHAWSAALHRRAAAAERYADGEHKSAPAATLDRLADELVAAEDALLAMPAPDLAALRWKLDRLLEVEADGFTCGHSAAHVAQTRADMGALLV